jgi:hypothetical protein
MAALIAEKAAMTAVAVASVIFSSFLLTIAKQEDKFQPRMRRMARFLSAWPGGCLTVEGPALVWRKFLHD